MSSAELHMVKQESSFNMLKAMVGIACLCALMIVLTFEGTFNRIQSNKAEALEKAIFKVLPGIIKKETFYINTNELSPEPYDENAIQKKVYAGYNADDNLVGFAVEANGIGFADVIRILYGYDPYKQKVVGFYVLESKETPGLGDKIEKDEAFLINFKDLDVSLKKDLSGPINTITSVKRGTKENKWELDGITGATISSRAIADIIAESSRSTLPLIYANYKQALQKPEKENNYE